MALLILAVFGAYGLDEPAEGTNTPATKGISRERERERACRRTETD